MWGMPCALRIHLTTQMPCRICKCTFGRLLYAMGGPCQAPLCSANASCTRLPWSSQKACTLCSAGISCSRSIPSLWQLLLTYSFLLCRCMMPTYTANSQQLSDTSHKRMSAGCRLSDKSDDQDHGTLHLHHLKAYCQIYTALTKGLPESILMILFTHSTAAAPCRVRSTGTSQCKAWS